MDAKVERRGVGRGAREPKNSFGKLEFPSNTPFRPHNQYTKSGISPRTEYRRFRRRLAWLRQLLAGDQVSVAALPEHSPRRKPSLPRLAFLEREAHWEPVGDTAATVVADLARRRP